MINGRPEDLVTFVTGCILGLYSVSARCGNRPLIEHTFKDKLTSPPYPEGANVNYVCLPEYRPEGNSLFTCGSGKWTGGPFSCIIKKCPELPPLQHGTMRGNTNAYAVGTVVRFRCDTGYELVGSETMLCLNDANWNSRNLTECRKIACPPKPSIKHGTIIVEHTVDGEDSVYGAILRVNCDAGYMRNGKVRVSCSANGQWTKLPQCKPVSCPEYPGINAKCVTKTRLEVESTLLFVYCTENSTFIYQGKDTASCVNRTWDNLSVGCFCGCEVKPQTDLVHLENVDFNGVLKHNEILNWTCTNGSTKVITEELICVDGLIGTPDCFTPTHSTIKPLVIYVMPALVVGVVIVSIVIYRNKKFCKLSITCCKNTEPARIVEDGADDENVSSNPDNADCTGQTIRQNGEVRPDFINNDGLNEGSPLLSPKLTAASNNVKDGQLSETTKRTTELTSGLSDNSPCIETDKKVENQLRRDEAAKYITHVLTGIMKKDQAGQ